MAIDIYRIIGELQQKRRENGISPPGVPQNDIWWKAHAEMRAELNRLYKEGLIEYHRTLNGWTAEIKRQDNGNDRTDIG